MRCAAVCSVRKHRAPNGALRQILARRAAANDVESESTEHQTVHYDGSVDSTRTFSSTVRKHRAPKCALRRGLVEQIEQVKVVVRKYRAPKGALRPDNDHHHAATQPHACQKAPSAKGALRQVVDDRADLGVGRLVRKHRASKGALRQLPLIINRIPPQQSESTEHQKVH